MPEIKCTFIILRIMVKTRPFLSFFDSGNVFCYDEKQQRTLLFLIFLQFRLQIRFSLVFV